MLPSNSLSKKVESSKGGWPVKKGEERAKKVESEVREGGRERVCKSK